MVWTNGCTIGILFPIFQAFPTDESRKPFLDFCKSSDSSFSLRDMGILFSIFQAFSTDERRFQNFEMFMTYHQRARFAVPERARFAVPLAYSFLSRTYLQYMRVAAALQAESGVDYFRVQAFYETRQEDPLPVLWGEDPFLAQALGAFGTANAHDFDQIYAQDYTALVDWCAAEDYVAALSETPRHIYNNAASIPDYFTNKEVEDFISYLDTTIAGGPPLKLDGRSIEPGQIVSIIKQMLGLKEKTGGTAGSFSPYLGYSMFYAKPESAKGDELLGRVWFLMKKIGESKHREDPKEDPETYKKSVVLAILEAAELSDGRVDTHCQTRMTGELMKAIAWSLPDSKLRQLIAAEDTPPAKTDNDIRALIASASSKAKQIFTLIHRGDTGEVLKVQNHHIKEDTAPELWELYQAYYDDLYRRTKNPDGTYRLDANTLTRDNHGNLVRAHLDNGTPRPPAEVEIVYYQAEFQVLEHAFTELMRRKFEEQRGLVY